MFSAANRINQAITSTNLIILAINQPITNHPAAAAIRTNITPEAVEARRNTPGAAEVKNITVARVAAKVVVAAVAATDVAKNKILPCNTAQNYAVYLLSRKCKRVLVTT